MTKKLLIRTFTIILILFLCYGVFWFYKSGQTEKFINNLVLSNNKNIQIASFDISGFPFSQVITFNKVSFSIPNLSIKDNKIEIDQLIAESSIFDMNFNLKIIGEVSVKNNNIVNIVDFTQKPVIKIKVAEAIISDFNYQDKGYRIFDQNKNLSYQAAMTNLNIKSTINEAGVINSKINLNIKNEEGFDIINIYKNSLENKIIDGIKTGNIKLGSSMTKKSEIDSNSTEEIISDSENVNTENNQPSAQQQKIIDETSQIIVAKNEDNSQINNVENENNKDTQKAETKIEKSTKTVKTQNLNKKIKPTTITKSDIKKTEKTVKKEIKTAQNNQEKKPKTEVETTKTQIQQNLNIVKKDNLENNVVQNNEKQVNPNSETMKVANTKSEKIAEATIENTENAINQTDKTKKEIELTEKTEKIAEEKLESLISEKTEEISRNDIIINAEYIMTPIKQEQSENIISDPMKMTMIDVKYNKSFKINKIEITNSHFNLSINGKVNNFKDDIKPYGYATIEINNSESFVKYLKTNLEKIANNNESKLESFDVSSEQNISQDTYSNFLKKISSNLDVVLSEIANKNQLSDNNKLILELRREKNLDFVINETPIREILGRF